MYFFTYFFVLKISINKLTIPKKKMGKKTKKKSTTDHLDSRFIFVPAFVFSVRLKQLNLLFGLHTTLRLFIV